MLSDLRTGGNAPNADLVERFDLGAHLTKPLHTLSGGTRQKVNAVLAFLFQPGLIVLDEPSAGLDPVASSVLKDRILEERGAGRTVVLASHLMTELDELADDIVFLNDGKVGYAGTTHALKLQTAQLSLERAIARMMLRGAA
jgi:Cu-processing system ATP-binding protein